MVSMKKFHHMESFLSLIFLCFFLAAGYAYGSQPSSVVVSEAASSSVSVLPDSNSGEVTVKSSDKSVDAITDEYKDEDDLDSANDKLKEERVEIADPLEPVNRAMHQLNDKLYFWALKPVARGYNAVVPEPARISVRSFFRNVAMPVRFVNSLFQGKFKAAGTELARFGINTTIGMVGFFDVAKSRFDLEAHNEDLGQTLGHYGMGGLMYIVWPFIGPSNVRDTIGFAGDSFLDPVSYIDPFEAAIGVNAYGQINKTSLELGTYEDMVESALEPYIAVRDAYIQYRNGLIKK